MEDYSVRRFRLQLIGLYFQAALGILMHCRSLTDPFRTNYKEFRGGAVSHCLSSIQRSISKNLKSSCHNQIAPLTTFDDVVEDVCIVQVIYHFCCTLPKDDVYQCLPNNCDFPGMPYMYRAHLFDMELLYLGDITIDRLLHGKASIIFVISVQSASGECRKAVLLFNGPVSAASNRKPANGQLLLELPSPTLQWWQRGRSSEQSERTVSASAE